MTKGRFMRFYNTNITKTEYGMMNHKPQNTSSIATLGYVLTKRISIMKLKDEIINPIFESI